MTLEAIRPSAARLDAATLGLTLTIVYAAITLLYSAPRRAFDFDELATVAVVGDGSPSAIWGALTRAADANPPTFYLLEALGRSMVSDPHVGFRLPTIAGFLGIPAALFLLVGSRCGRLAGLAAALVPFVTALMTFYPLEARPYTLVACAVAWAWVAWQQVEKRGRAVALGGLLAAATAFHYYAIFSLVPFGLAELARTIRLGERRLRVWVALFAGCAPLAAFWPLLTQFNQQYGGAFWARPQLLNAYAELMGLSDRLAAPLVLLLIVAIAATAVRARPSPERRDPSTINLEDWVVAVAFITLPFFIYVVARLLGITMVSRYAIAAVLGTSAGAAMVAFRAGGRRGVSWLITATVLVIAFQQADYWRWGRVVATVASDHGDINTLEALIRRSEAPALPVAVANGLRYLPMAYYGGPSPKTPILYVIDLDAAIKGIGTDSVDRALTSLAPFMPMRLEERQAFLAANARFLLFAENESWDWLTPRLVADGHAMRLIAEDVSGGGNHMLFLVETRKPTAPKVE